MVSAPGHHIIGTDLDGDGISTTLLPGINGQRTASFRNKRYRPQRAKSAAAIASAATETCQLLVNFQFVPLAPMPCGVLT